MSNPMSTTNCKQLADVSAGSAAQIDDERIIITTILRHYPTAQAVYLFGSLAAGEAWPDSDADIAVLLPPAESRQVLEKVKDVDPDEHDKM